MSRQGLGSAPREQTEKIDRTSCPRWIAGRHDAKAHGTENAYCLGCRCDDARDIRRIRMKRRREGRAISEWVDATGTTRRLRALAAMGWTIAFVAERGGFPNKGVLERIRRGENKWVFRSTATRVQNVCREVGYQPGPSVKAAAHARRLGWVSLMAWDGDIDDPLAQPWVGDDGDIDDAPDENAADALMTRRLRWHEVAVTDRRWAVSVPLAHLSNIELGRSLGVDSETVRRARRNYAEAQQKHAA